MKLPTYRKHKAKNRAFVEYQTIRTYLPGKYGSEESKLAYENFIDQIKFDRLLKKRESRKQYTPAEMKKTRIGDLLIDYFEYAALRYGEKSNEMNQLKAIARPLNAMFGGMLIIEFGPRALKALRQAMIDGTHQKRVKSVKTIGWSRKHVNDQVGRLRRIFKWGISEEMVSPQVLLSLQAVEGLQRGKCQARETDQIAPADWAQIKKLKPFCPPMLWDMITLHYLTGMRSAELTAMTPGQIDRSDKTWIYKPSKHKTQHRGKTKEIAIGPQGQMILNRHAPKAKNGFFFRPEENFTWCLDQRRKPGKTPRTISIKPNRVFRERYDSKTYYRAIHYAMQRAEKAGVDIPHWHPHQLRHTRADITKEQYGVEGVQAQTGNTLKAAELYTERMIAKAKQIAAETG